MADLGLSSAVRYVQNRIVMQALALVEITWTPEVPKMMAQIHEGHHGSYFSGPGALCSSLGPEATHGIPEAPFRQKVNIAVYVHAYISIHIHVSTHIRIHILYTCKYKCIHIYICIHIYVYIYIYIIYIYIY